MIRISPADSRSLSLLFFLGPALATPLHPQASFRLNHPLAVFPEDFGFIQTVRELPDGRVLVPDPLGKALYVVDFSSGQRRMVGREGEGPAEYRQPDAVWPLPGDSTLLVDLGNGRLVALGPDLSFGPTMPLVIGELRPDQPPTIALPHAVDGTGRIYSRALSGSLAGGHSDSARIVRIDRRNSSVAFLATVKIPGVQRSEVGGAENREVRATGIPLSPEDAWGVTPDGTLIIARSRDYHLEILTPDGRLVRGPRIAYDPVPIGDREKEEHLTEAGRGGGGLSMMMRVEGGVVSAAFSRGGMAGAPDPRQAMRSLPWPDRKPPFYGGPIPVDPRGRAWVRRHVKAGSPVTYDLFDVGGHRVGVVTLNPGRRVVGFGKSAVYVVAFDEFDLAHLEKHPLPVL